MFLVRVLTRLIHQNQTKKIKSDIAVPMQVQGNQRDECLYEINQTLKSVQLQGIQIFPQQALLTSAE